MLSVNGESSRHARGVRPRDLLTSIGPTVNNPGIPYLKICQEGRSYVKCFYQKNNNKNKEGEDKIMSKKYEGY